MHWLMWAFSLIYVVEIGNYDDNYQTNGTAISSFWSFHISEIIIQSPTWPMILMELLLAYLWENGIQLQLTRLIKC